MQYINLKTTLTFLNAILISGVLATNPVSWQFETTTLPQYGISCYLQLQDKPHSKYDWDEKLLGADAIKTAILGSGSKRRLIAPKEIWWEHYTLDWFPSGTAYKPIQLKWSVHIPRNTVSWNGAWVNHLVSSCHILCPRN